MSANQKTTGYSLTIKNPLKRSNHSLILGESFVAVTPIGKELRFAGTLELAGLNLKINPLRVEGIKNAVFKYLPEMVEEKELTVTPWAGLRPLSFDGLPYIGRFPGFINLTVGTGHAMMGISQGPATGKLISQLITRQPLSLPLEPFNPSRR